MNFHTSDVRADVAQRIGNRSLYLGHEGLVPYDVLVGIHLDLHDSVSYVDAGEFVWGRARTSRPAAELGKDFAGFVDVAPVLTKLVLELATFVDRAR